MKLNGLIFSGHKWLGNGAVKGVMVAVGLVCMVLGSDAGSVWGPLGSVWGPL